MQRTVEINNQSFDEAGIPKDWKDAFCELIWNGFDAKATAVEINYDADEVGHLKTLEIIDNGAGIDYETLDDTFGKFLSSLKQARKRRTSYQHGKKGRGRFSFKVFAPRATWKTTYKSKGKLHDYEIKLNTVDLTHFEDIKPRASSKKETGTTISVDEFSSLSAGDLQSDDFLLHLKREFGWYLQLNSDRNFSIQINEEPLSYKDIIADSDKVTFTSDEESGGCEFNIHFIRWKEKTKEKFYFYFLDEEQNEKGKKLTSFNNKSDQFYHSVYVQSDYFNKFALSDDNDQQLSALDTNESDLGFKELVKYLHEYLLGKRKEFIRKDSEKVIKKFEHSGVMPKFADTEIEKEKEKEFKEVIKEVYTIEPKIFTRLGDEQAKTMLGLFNLVLDTDERENVMKILEGVVDLSKEQRQELASVLQKTKLANVVRVLKMIEQRYKSVEILRSLVFDLRKFTNERDQIQKAMEESYWLLAEQYHLVTADQDFENLLSEYLYIIDDKKDEKAMYKIDHPERLKRPDLFMCRQRIVDDPNSESRMEENILVELKEPERILNRALFRQVEDYMEVIINEPQFNSSLRTWKFYMIGKKPDSFIQGQYKAFQDKGRKFLVKKVDQYEMYAITWDDLFTSFELRHEFLYEKLQYDKKALKEEMDLMHVDLSKEKAIELTEKLKETATLAV